MSIQPYLEILSKNRDLNYDEAYKLQDSILKGSFEKKELLELFKILESKKISKPEFNGFFQASKAHMLKVEVDYPIFDIAGTGGDNIDTFNISTVSMFVLAGCDVAVAKHGNRSVTSKVGSADILEYLGVNIDLTPKQVKKALDEIGVVFIFAPKFHPAFKNTAEARKEYKKRTYFNYLGPILNPASPEYSLVGVSDPEYNQVIGETLIENGTKGTWIVRGEGGINDISTLADTHITEFIGKNSKEFDIELEKLGIDFASEDSIVSGDIEYNAKVFMNVLENRANKDQMYTVLMNVGACLVINKKAENLIDGIKMAYESIVSGKALEKFEELRDFEW